MSQVWTYIELRWVTTMRTRWQSYWKMWTRMMCVCDHVDANAIVLKRVADGWCVCLFGGVLFTVHDVHGQWTVPLNIERLPASRSISIHLSLYMFTHTNIKHVCEPWHRIVSLQVKPLSSRNILMSGGEGCFHLGTYHVKLGKHIFPKQYDAIARWIASTVPLTNMPVPIGHIECHTRAFHVQT